MRAALLLGLPLLACNRREPYENIDPEAAVISDYHGLEDGASWIYRDDGADTEPEESSLLRAQLSSDTIELRRGARWADADPVGHLSWSWDDGLTLTGWSLPSGTEGASEVLVSGEIIEFAEGCEYFIPEEGWPTYHGTFEDAVVFSCTEPLAVELAFGLGVGLVWLQTDDDTLDLVAPW